MGASLDMHYGYGFITGDPQEEDNSLAFEAMGIEFDEDDPSEAYYAIIKKFPGVEVASYGHYDYCYGYMIYAASTEGYSWDGAMEVSTDTFGVPTMDEIAALSSVLGYFYPDGEKHLGHMVTVSYG